MTKDVKNPTPPGPGVPISAREALLALSEGRLAFIDVRSEGEFAEAGIEGFVNLPILHDPHRHEVGICYVRKGQDAAIELGHQLVEPLRETMVDAWVAQTARDGRQGAIVTCWRGGLRSKIASEWIAARGVAVRTVAGGYKAMRRELLSALEAPPPIILLCGLTGSGKTRLLHALERAGGRTLALDLEDLAKHRGSSFGRMTTPQPRQAWFENSIGLRWLRAPGRTFAVEDESRAIGRLGVPGALDRKMDEAPRVILNASLEERCQHIFEEYVSEPLRAGMAPAELQTSLLEALLRLEKRLGGLRARELSEALKRAFAEGPERPEAHVAWVEPLLTHYYDPLYTHAAARRQGPLAFEGDARACLEFLRAYPEAR